MDNNIHRIERVRRLGAPWYIAWRIRAAVIHICRGSNREQCDRSEKPPPAQSDDDPVSFNAYQTRGGPCHFAEPLICAVWPPKCRGPPVRSFHHSLNDQDRAEEINVDSFKEIHAELTKLKEEQDRLNYYILLLEPRPMRVLKRTYIERASNEDVAKELGISVRRLQEVKNQAIESLAEMYEYTESLH